MTFRIIAYHLRSGKTEHSFIYKGDSTGEVINRFYTGHPDMVIKSVEPIEDITIPIKTPCKCSSSKRRSHYKARLCQVRGNLQSMTDSEEGLLTTEEILAIQRISCKLDRVIALFNTRTMDLKNEGKL